MIGARSLGLIQGKLMVCSRWGKTELDDENPRLIALRDHQKFSHLLFAEVWKLVHWHSVKAIQYTIMLHLPFARHLSFK